jgi:SnoaL-like protein
MNPSVELRDFMLRSYEAMSTGDVLAIEHLLLHQDGVPSIGTDPNEWWAGYKTIIRIHQAQFQELGGKIRAKAGNPMTFTEGTKGWVPDPPHFHLSYETIICAETIH